MLERIVDGRTDLVFDWIAAGGAADARALDNVPLIRWCAYYGDVSAIRHLLQHGERLHSLGENLDLNGAAFHGHWQLCQFLIEYGADPRLPLQDTLETPLHAALCKAGQPEFTLVVRVLLSAGADPNAKTAPNVETGGFMRDCRTRGETPLHRAAAFADLECIDLLLNAGAVVDAKDCAGDTPLSWASWHLRPGAILQKLCYGPYRVNANYVQRATDDHGCGNGWRGMGRVLRGTPHL